MLSRGYLETCQHCASLLTRSSSFHLSLSTSLTQELQVCTSNPLPFSTGMRSTCADEKTNLPAISHQPEEYLGCTAEWKFWQKSFAAALKGVCMFIDHTLNILSRYDPCGLTTWTLQFYRNIPEMVMHAQAVNFRLFFSPPTQPGNEANAVNTCSAKISLMFPSRGVSNHRNWMAAMEPFFCSSD